MVNGTPIALEGQEGEAIKECLLRGAIPNQDLLNHLLYKVQAIILVNSRFECFRHCAFKVKIF